VTSARLLIVETTGALSKAGLVAALRAGRPVGPAQLLEAVQAGKPQVVLVEVGVGGAELLAAVEAVMAERPTPMLLMVGDPQGRKAAMTLLAAGALDVMALPGELDPAFLATLNRHLKLLATVKVVRHPRGRRRPPEARVPPWHQACPVVAVAASLGGPKALASLLSALPRPFAAPVLVCQHITPGFSDDLAIWLDAETGHRVLEAADGQELVPGEVLVAPAHAHLRISERGRVKLDDGAPVGGFKPSCDVMLSSVAEAFGGRAIGVVLTGMGRDGAKGLAEVRRRGGHTVAQDEGSCVVFGMPRAAIALGAAEQVLPLSDIAGQLTRWVA